MNYREPPRTTTRRISWILVAGLPVVMVAIAVDLCYHSFAASSSAATTPISTDVGYQTLGAPSPFARLPIATESAARRAHDSSPGDRPGVVGEADGVVPDGVTVFDDQYPAVAKLNPALLGAIRQAATDAASDGIEFYVNSGWRSAKYQEQLLQDAISQYGSEEEAARWVATPNTSAHVTGDAIDLGPSDATAWLSKNGVKYGLCQIYSNEPWHYELRPDAVDNGCPPMYADPTQDPRMQQ